MNKPYLIMVEGRLWDRKLTRVGALKVISELNHMWQQKGMATRAVIAYECEVRS